jgi:addiction module RelB/DinJ family antitoxin
MSITFSVRTDKALKADAEKVLADIGLSLNTVINLMMRQVVIQRGVPFDMRSSDGSPDVKAERKKLTNNQNALDYAYAIAKKVHQGEISADAGAEQIAALTGRTASTELLTIQMLCCMLDGTVYDMRRDATTTRRFLELIYEDPDFTEVEQENARLALQLHIDKISESGTQANPVSLKEILFDYSVGETAPVQQFRKYLEDKGYSKANPSGGRSTIDDYIYRVNTIVEREGLTWSDLTSSIGFLCEKYESGGAEEEFGRKSHRSYINALKRFQDMCCGS